MCALGAGSAAMNAMQWLAAAAAAGLLVYLVVALLRPEDFA
jgi:K+-transporting ATPase KdpF subunit